LADIRLQTVIRAVVFLGPNMVGIAERAVYALGEVVVSDVLALTDLRVKNSKGRKLRSGDLFKEVRFHNVHIFTFFSCSVKESRV
jgi:hypothetical protein